jgi:hypothetical protein
MQVIWSLTFVLPTCVSIVFLNLFSLWASFLLISLLLLFSGALAMSWIQKREISCNCFGESDSSTSYPVALARNALLFLLLLLNISTPSLDFSSFSSFFTTQYILALMISLVLLLAVLFIRMLWRLYQVQSMILPSKQLSNSSFKKKAS